MKEKLAENDLSGWFSSYGLITAQRIYERFNISLSQDELIYSLKTPGTFYHQLLSIPLRMVFNGIIMEQVNDYQKYAQKLFIDYLLSGESGKPSDSPGAMTRDDLEEQRQILIKMNEGFQKLEIRHEKLIASSQASLINISKTWQEKLHVLSLIINKKLIAAGINISEQVVMQALQSLLVELDYNLSPSARTHSWKRVETLLGSSLSQDLKQVFIEETEAFSLIVTEFDSIYEEYSSQVSQINQDMKRSRTDFYEFILRVTELLSLLPEYKVDPVQSLENRESLYFDTALGENPE
jgi:hypothetical protein